jgi:copper oxidase (laccase) domain-containing protein
MMQDAGVIDENIIDSNICTNCNSDYFHSKRKEGADDFNINGCLMSLK